MMEEDETLCVFVNNALNTTIPQYKSTHYYLFYPERAAVLVITELARNHSFIESV